MTASHDAAGFPVWDTEHLRLGVKAAGVALWAWNVDSDGLTMDEIGYELWAQPAGGPVSFEDLSANIHPADRDRVRAAFNATRGIVGPYEIDFRILIHDEVRWISARGRGDDENIRKRVMYGVFLDVTGRKQAEEAHELLAGEMSHRVKNLIAIAGALTTMTSRSSETKEDMARELTQRLTALGRAHDLVRPVPGQTENAALLGDLITVLLMPYDDLGAFAGRIRVSVPRMGIGEAAATNLALVLHELATNSVKHGALSTEGGLLDVACLIEGEVAVIVWTERGGPAVKPPGADEGFGSKLLQRIMTHSLAGSIDYDWSPDGLIARLRIHTSRLER
ncbi:MAG TPA: HWE histidine kinase domain-containing protein [Brevundimonas sp.]|nr:HWE histidine kinase domain-containing protein [Brevundimonas sp.]